ncbi:hypothetical protein INT44_006772 [Umbelopsis vinacea]|uniref:Uncharacterized protein n=1 Tax=Umbelopsis vinacea TaxID=44442 RepID=A0A8H7PI60_9FUNG|nr:hypothetical protein INT44_006772 [Umbelopsis vinacea]
MGLDSQYAYHEELNDSDHPDQTNPAAAEPLMHNPFSSSPTLTANDTRIAVQDHSETAEPRLCRICQSGEDDSDDDATIADEEVDLVSSEPYHRTSHEAHHSKVKRVYAKNPLIKPCKCKGSQGFGIGANVSRLCTSVGEKNLPEQLRHMPVIFAVTNITYTGQLAFIVAIASILAYLIDTLALHNPARTVAIYFACGIATTAIIGFVAFIYRCATEGADSVTMPIWCCPDGCSSLYLADCGALGGGDAALAGLLFVVAFIIMTVLLFGLIGAVGGVYIFVERHVENVAGKVKERILDVE